eukprot:7385089-Prymnesium_polylepis.1
MNGRFGVDYVSQLLAHWFDTAHASWSRAVRVAPRIVRDVPMPLPLHPSNNESRARPMRCFGFKPTVDDQYAQALYPIAWCSSAQTFGLQRRVSVDAGAWNGPGCKRAAVQGCPKRIFWPGAQAAFNSFMVRPPRYWFWCRFSLSAGNKKVSP